MQSRRMISFLLSVLMLISLIPTAVFADETPASVAEEPAVEVVAEEAEEIEEVITDEVEENDEEIIADEVEEITEEIITEEAPVLEATDSKGHELVTSTVDSSLYPECVHENRAYGYSNYDFEFPNAVSLTVTFAAESYFGYDEYLEITTADGIYVGYYDYWNPASGASFTVEGNNFHLKLYSSGNTYGFAIDSIVATVAKHSGSTAGTNLAPTCTENGYKTGYICDICGEDIHGETLPATGHDFAVTVTAPTATAFGYSTFSCKCGESYKGKYRGYNNPYQGDINDTMSWIMQNGVLYILGTGEMPDGWIDYNNYVDQEGITSVVISEGITRIGDGAFTNEDNIVSVTIPSTVKTIGDEAFCGMTSLKSITLPEGLKEIGRDAFYNSGITSITIPDSVLTVSQNAFGDCYNLAEVNFGSGVETIELWAFQRCTSLTSVYFPYNVEYIAQSAFRYCSKLQEITFGEPVARGGFGDGLYLGTETFAYCDLRDVYLPTHTYNIDGSTFACNPKLTAVHISTTQTLNGIEGPEYRTDDRGCVYEWDLDFTTNEYYKRYLVVVSGALSGSYTVPDCVRTIEAEIRDMPNLTSFTFGAGYGGIWNSYAFVNCPKLTTVKAGGSANDDNGWYNDASGALFYTGNEGQNCQLYFVPANATEYTIPANCTSIASSGALTNAKLKNIYVASGNSVFKSINGVLYSSDVTHLYAYPSGRTDTTFYVPETVENIESCAFKNCTAITDVYFTGDNKWVDFTAFGTQPITIWYPANNDTWDPEYLQSIADEYGRAFGTHITFKSYSGEKETKLAAPVAKGANIASTGKIQITWDAVEGATRYEVYKSTSKSGEYTRAVSTTGTSYKNTGAVANTTYYYYVVAIHADGTRSENSNIVSRTCDCAQPVITLSNVASSGKIKVSWKAIDGAAKYDVYRASSKTGKYSRKVTITSTSWTDTNTTAGKTYYYKVVARGTKSAADSAYSEIKSRTADLAQPSITLSNVESSGKNKVSWKAVSGAAKYEVSRATSKTGTYSRKVTTTSTSWTDTNTTAGKTYYYKVKAIHSKSAANSAYSLVKARTCDLARPTVKITTSSGKPKVSWSAVSGATKYKIYRATSKSGTYSLVKTTTSKYWKDTTAKKGKTYYYKVVAANSNSAANSAYSSVKYIKCTK